MSEHEAAPNSSQMGSGHASQHSSAPVGFSGPDDDAQDLDPILWAEPPLGDIYNTIRWLVRILGGGLVLLFGWLQLSGADYATIASSLPARTTFRLALALYFGSWVSGLMFDLAIQERTYNSPPNHGRGPAILTGLLLTVVFGLCVWGNDARRFSGLLAVFLILNVVSWRWMVDKVLPKTVADSRAAFRGDYAKLERLRIAYQVYLRGRWQTARFITAGVGVIALNVLVRTDVSPVVTAAAILGFVVLIEGWIWLVRLQVGTNVRLLDRLAKHYDLTPAKHP